MITLLAVIELGLEGQILVNNTDALYYIFDNV